MGACCQPHKIYIKNNREIRTRNIQNNYSGHSQNSQNTVRTKGKRNQRKGKLNNQINQYDDILGDDYQDNGLNLKDIQDLQIHEVANLSSQPLKKSNQNILNKKTSVSSCNPNIVYSLYDSRKGRKQYQSTYPKMPA